MSGVAAGIVRRGVSTVVYLARFTYQRSMPALGRYLRLTICSFACCWLAEDATLIICPSRATEAGATRAIADTLT